MVDRDLLDLQRQSYTLTHSRIERPFEYARGGSQPSAIDRVACKVGDATCGQAHAGTISRSLMLDRSAMESSLLRLQRNFGNQYVARVIDRVTEDDGGSEAAIARGIDGARGGGQALDHTVRRSMESSFDANFGTVRVHTDERADTLSRSLSARAFTTGTDIFFRQGEYNPGSSSGRELLAHELTHVVQQNGAEIQRKLEVSTPGDPHELEADEMAKRAMAQEHRGIESPTAVTAQRQEMTPVEDEQEIAAKSDAAALLRQADVPEEEKEKEPLAMKLDRRCDRLRS